ncbi:MAG: hypothetical protein GXO64_01235 [Candidatus Micrarchaeota archaeon]|nr:hypothetical protein [Candidatus Micrarchaeota archaeon]
MAVERQTSRKVRIKDVVNGRWIKNEGMVPSFAITFYGEKVSRAEIVGTVVSIFISENGNFRTVTVDDSTETIRLKAFKPVEDSGTDSDQDGRIARAMKSFDILKDIQVGDIVDVIGRLREYNGEIYIMPEVVRKTTADNEMLFRALVLEKILGAKKTGEITSRLRERFSDDSNIEEYIKKNYPDIKRYWLDLSLNKVQEPVDDRIGLRKQIMTIIEVSSDGIKYKELLSKIKGHDSDIEAVINDLLNEGICYEPMPGVIKKI